MLAVVGLGNWGKNLVRNFAELGALSAICDSDPAVLDRFGSTYPGLKAYSSLYDVLADSDIAAVALAVPGVLHYEMASAVLGAGKHLFVEKPMAHSVAEVSALNHLAGDRVLMVGHLLEYHPAFVKLQELVVAGELGHLRHLYSRRLALGRLEPGQNVLWSLAPHDVSMLLRLAGEMPDSVQAVGQAALSPGLADVALAWLVFPGGLRAHLLASWLNPVKEQRLVAIGDAKMAVFDDVEKNEKLRLYSYSVLRDSDPPALRSGEPQPVAVSAAEPLRSECAHFLDCIGDGKQPRTGGASALRVTRVLEACQRSMDRDGEAIALAGEEVDEA